MKIFVGALQINIDGISAERPLASAGVHHPRTRRRQRVNLSERRAWEDFQPPGRERPGPRHVLDLADQLHLSDDQRQQTQELFERMNAEARRLGERIIEQEETLDALFASGEAAEDEVEALVAHIGSLQANLRYTHLRAHLEMAGILKPAQVDHYVRLRGYDDGAGGHDGHASHG